LSSVRCRTSIPAAEDVARLEQAVQDPATVDVFRLIAAEALALRNEVAALQGETLARIIRDLPKPPPSLSRRTLQALCLSDGLRGELIQRMSVGELTAYKGDVTGIIGEAIRVYDPMLQAPGSRLFVDT